MLSRDYTFQTEIEYQRSSYILNFMSNVQCIVMKKKLVFIYTKVILFISRKSQLTLENKHLIYKASHKDLFGLTAYSYEVYCSSSKIGY